MSLRSLLKTKKCSSLQLCPNFSDSWFALHKGYVQCIGRVLQKQPHCGRLHLASPFARKRKKTIICQLSRSSNTLQDNQRQRQDLLPSQQVQEAVPCSGSRLPERTVTVLFNLFKSLQHLNFKQYTSQYTCCTTAATSVPGQHLDSQNAGSKESKVTILAKRSGD